MGAEMKIRHALIAAAAALAIAASGTVTAQEAGETGEVDVPSVDNPPDHTPAEVPKRSVEERLQFLLSGYEYFPTREDLDELADADTIAGLLREMTADEDNRNTKRLRAMDALGYYDDPETLELLKSYMAPLADDVPRKQLRIRTLLRHHAITAFARSQKTDAVDTLASLLENDDMQIRLTAISALGKHGGKPGLKVLKAALEKAETPTITRALKKWVR
jgi:HEAT repeat protein